jgi:hypothetical protein
MHGYALNHTALAVHRMHAPGALPHLSLGDAARAMTDHGLTMNQEGGVLRVMPLAYTTGRHWEAWVFVHITIGGHTSCERSKLHAVYACVCMSLLLLLPHNRCCCGRPAQGES